MRRGDDHSEGSVLCRKTSIGHIYRNYTEYKHLLMKCFVAALRRFRVDPQSHQMYFRQWPSHAAGVDIGWNDAMLH